MNTDRKSSNRSLLLTIANLLWCLTWAYYAFKHDQILLACLNSCLVFANIWLIRKNRQNLKWSEELDRRWDELMAKPELQEIPQALPKDHKS